MRVHANAHTQAHHPPNVECVRTEVLTTYLKPLVVDNLILGGIMRSQMMVFLKSYASIATGIFKRVDSYPFLRCKVLKLRTHFYYLLSLLT